MNTLILICLICCVWPISGAEKDAYCFQYTWPGPMYANSSSVNCTSDKFKGVPCITPIIVGSRPPNISYLWDKWDKETKLNPHLCTLQDGYACISYSYIYNNAVLNTSHYCGKIIEDKTVAITSGCFYYKVDGHIIEVCACRSTGSKPCNTATKQTSSVITLLSSVVMLFYNFYNK